MNIINTQLVPALNTASITGRKTLPFIKKKLSKRIEIVTIPELADCTQNHCNIGIELDADLIHSILSSVYENVQITEIKEMSALKRLILRRPDLVFSGVKYFDFDDKQIWLNDHLDLHNIAYMASSRKALDREFDKSNAKILMQKAGIPTANFFITKPDAHPTESALPIPFPLFVKPVAGGDSEGIDAHSVVNNFTSFQRKVAEIWGQQNYAALVETYLSGKEYSVGIFEDHETSDLTAMPIEIIVPENENGQRILDYDAKRFDSETVIAVNDPVIHDALATLAKAAFKVLGGRSFGRIDIKMDHNNVPHFMEANLMPGLRKGYFYRSCALNLDMSYEQMILKIAANGLMVRSSARHKDHAG